MKTEPQKEHRWLQKLVGEWTYESETSMEPGFAGAFDQVIKARATRFVNNNDIVPHVPTSGPVLRYWHTNRLIYIDAEGNLKPDMPLWKHMSGGFKGAIQDLDKLGPDALKDHAMDNYIHYIRQSIK